MSISYNLKFDQQDSSFLKNFQALTTDVPFIEAKYPNKMIEDQKILIIVKECQLV